MVNQSSEPNKSEWFEEQLDAHVKWSFAINRILHHCTSQYQEIALLDTKPFGKVLIIDGKLQSAEADEFIYHENLVHPALLLHSNPKKVFIMGGGEGSTARELLKHRTVEKVIMCDIDKEVVEFCRVHLTENRKAFADPRLQIIINDSKAELEARTERFDVIIGDLADPIEGGPCNGLYTKSIHLSDSHKAKAERWWNFCHPSVLSHKDIFSPIYNTIKHVFKHVVAYTAPVPSYADTCGWVVAWDGPIKLDIEKISQKIQERMTGTMHYLDPAFIVSSNVLNKTVHTSLVEETQGRI